MDIFNFANTMQRTSWNRYFFNENNTVSLAEYLRNVKDGLDQFYLPKDYDINS